MTAGPPTGGTSADVPRRGRRVALVTGVVAVLVGLVIAVGPPASERPYDPDGVGPTGLGGLVELLEESSGQVDVSTDPPIDLSTRLLVPTDRGSASRDEAILDWVERGGTLVVTADAAALHGLEVVGAPVQGALGALERRPGCPATALAGVQTIEHTDWTSFAVPEDATQQCFVADDGAAWLVVRTRGQGHVAAIGSARPFTNAELDRAHNAGLATALLAPGRDDRVAIMPPPTVGDGDATLMDLVPAGFWRLILLGTMALLVAIVWTARRLGRPVEERLPPVLPSAELARSVAALLQRAGDRSSAAARLRTDARRVTARTLGVPTSSDTDTLVSLVIARTGVPPGHAEVALHDRPVDDDAALLEVADACRSLRLRLRSGAATGSSDPIVERGSDDGEGPGPAIAPELGSLTSSERTSTKRLSDNSTYR